MPHVVVSQYLEDKFIHRPRLPRNSPDYTISAALRSRAQNPPIEPRRRASPPPDPVTVHPSPPPSPVRPFFKSLLSHSKCDHVAADAELWFADHCASWVALRSWMSPPAEVVKMMDMNGEKFENKICYFWDADLSARPSLVVCRRDLLISPRKD